MPRYATTLSIRLSRGTEVPLGEHDAAPPDVWWKAANTPRRINLARAMALRFVQVFDANGVHRATVEIFGVASANGSSVTLSGAPRRPDMTATPPARAGMYTYGEPEEDARRGTALALASTWLSWEQRHRNNSNMFGLEPAPWLAAEMNAIPAPSRVLVLGAGEGRNALHLARAGHVVTAVDMSPTAIARCRESAAREGVDVETIIGDAVRWLESSDADRHWDVAVLNYFAAGSPAATEHVLSLLRTTCDSLIAEFARGVVGEDVVLAGWGEARLSFAEAKVPVVRVHRQDDGQRRA